MSTESIERSWNELKGKFKQRFDTITDNDLLFDEGKKEEMYGKLQTKLGKTKEELQRIISGM